MLPSIIQNILGKTDKDDKLLAYLNQKMNEGKQVLQNLPDFSADFDRDFPRYIEENPDIFSNIMDNPPPQQPLQITDKYSSGMLPGAGVDEETQAQLDKIPNEEYPGINEVEAAPPEEEIVYNPKPIESDEEFEQRALPIFKKYALPPEIGLGMFAAEGRHNSKYAERNNYYNMQALDSNPDAALAFDTPEQGIEAFAKFITGKANDGFYADGKDDDYGQPLIESEKKKLYAEAFERYHATGNVEQYMEDIFNIGYAGDPSTYAERADNGYSSYSDFVMDTPEWKKGKTIPR